MMNPDYEISEEDIDLIVEYLKIYHADKANREYAIRVLEKMYRDLHIIRNINPEIIEKIVDELGEN